MPIGKAGGAVNDDIPHRRIQHRRPDDGGKQREHQHGARRGVLGGFRQRVPIRARQVHRAFHRRVDEFGRDHQRDRQPYPQQRADRQAQHERQRQHDDRGTHVNAHVSFLTERVHDAFIRQSRAAAPLPPRLDQRTRRRRHRTNPASRKMRSWRENMSRSDASSM